MKKTSNSKKGTMPGGAPKGMHPLTYFNSLKGKTKVEPKQNLKKAQEGTEMTGQDIMDAKTKNTYNQINSLKDEQTANRQQIVDSGNEFKNNLIKSFPNTFGQ
jgi:hypothetical protein